MRVHAPTGATGTDSPLLCHPGTPQGVPSGRRIGGSSALLVSWRTTRTASSIGLACTVCSNDLGHGRDRAGPDRRGAHFSCDTCQSLLRRRCNRSPPTTLPVLPASARAC